MSVLQDKKKLPIIIGVVVLVLALATGGILYATGVIGAKPQEADNSTPAPMAPPVPPPGAHMPPGVPGGPGGPGMLHRPGMRTNPALVAKANQDKKKAALAKANASKKKTLIAKKPAAAPAATGAAAAAGTKVAANTPPDPATVPDPFKLPKVEAPVQPTDHQIPGVPMIPNPILTNWRPERKVPLPVQTGPVSDPGSTGRRMAGVLFGDGVYAILETNGKTEAVQPGDTVAGGKVESIEADGLTIKTDDDRIIHVPLSSTSTGGEDTGTGPAGYPGYGGVPPGMGGYPPGFAPRRNDNAPD